MRTRLLTLMASRRRTLAGGAVTAALAVTTTMSFASPANADVETRGTCSASSTWEADLERGFGAYGFDFEVKTAESGQQWRLSVAQNGKRVYANTRTATADVDDRYADVDWELVRPDRPNISDRFELVARNLVTGETCRTTLRG